MQIEEEKMENKEDVNASINSIGSNPQFKNTMILRIPRIGKIIICFSLDNTDPINFDKTAIKIINGVDFSLLLEEIQRKIENLQTRNSKKNLKINQILKGNDLFFLILIFRFFR